ncbi:RimK/LysX family protein [uncultured Draconibacterium sp.]|uniref:ATP-dependent zinc protease family protein n=1 Tax=uncultured Draconibacterium sp. TaxID=1573823 RepID=UPI0025F24376|nr:RimK/LysX family protein [uncultured Draconibacterium sp.]
MQDVELTRELIGRKDFVDFPQLALTEIKTKIDTGAYTSSINCHYVAEEIINGEAVLVCIFLDPQHPKYDGKEFRFSKYKKKRIKSSNGISENRFLIRTEIKLFNKLYLIDLSLADRRLMKYDVLIGRKFLNKKFLVDTSVSNLSHKLVKKTKVNTEK